MQYEYMLQSEIADNIQISTKLSTISTDITTKFIKICKIDKKFRQFIYLQTDKGYRFHERKS